MGKRKYNVNIVIRNVLILQCFHTFGFTVSEGCAARVFSHESSSTGEAQHTTRLRLEGAQRARLAWMETISRELTSRALAYNQRKTF